MAKFQIYTYMFHPVMEHHGEIPLEEFQEIDVQDSVERKQELLGKILDGGNILRFEFKGILYEHKTYIRRDGIYLFRIANNGHRPVKVEKDFRVQSEMNHPSCLVIVDNRKDRQVIAIEHRGRKSAFGKAPSLAAIIQKTLRVALQGYRLSLDVTPKFHTAEFWQVVDVAMTRSGIEYVDFPFAYPNLPEISDMVGEYMSHVARLTNSEPTLHLQGQNRESVRLDPAELWLLNAIRACAASGRPILVKPKGTKLRKIGVDSPVYEEIADWVLEQLEQGELFDSKYQSIVDFLNTVKLVYE